MLTFITIAKALFCTSVDSRMACAIGAIHTMGTYEVQKYWLCRSDDGESGLYDAIWEASQGQTPSSMIIGDIDTILAATNKNMREIDGEYHTHKPAKPACSEMLLSNIESIKSIEKENKDNTVKNVITKMQNELVLFHMKRSMKAFRAYELVHNARGMADYLNSLNLAPIGWEIKGGPRTREKDSVVLEHYAVGDRVEAVWIERNKGEGKQE